METSSAYESEWRIPGRAAILLLAMVALVLTFVSDRVPSAPQLRVQLLALLCYAFAGLCWLVSTRSALLARWLAIAGFAALFLSAAYWLDQQELLALAGVPVALAAALVGLGAAGVVAVGETAFLVVLGPHLVVGFPSLMTSMALAGIWATAAITLMIYLPVYQRAGWLHTYFQYAENLVEDARDRKAELEAAVASVANANRQLALANERISALRLIAEDAQRTKAAFVAKVSHEFRTPLNMIIGLVELMVENPGMYTVALPPEMEQDLRVVHRNCEHLAGMVSDVLDLTRIETGRVVLHKERVDLADIIDEAVTAVRPLVEKKRLYLRLGISSDLPAVYCDRTRMRQVVLNLISNAARFTDKGGISVAAEIRDQQVVVRVTDTGPGIPQEDVEHIFEPFCQGESALWRDRGGSGLGLTISQQFVRLHHGRLWLESEVGVGSTFAFQLPVSPPVEHMARPGHWIRGDWDFREQAFLTDGAGVAEQAAKPRVVVLDEANSLCPELARYVDEIEVTEVQGAAEVAQQVRNYPASAVIINASSSEDLLSLVEQAAPGAGGTPLIGCSVPVPVERAKAAGALGYLIKPVSPDDLRRTLGEVGVHVKRVLVVDDDPDVLGLFRRMLTTCDPTLEVEVVSSGEQALVRLRNTHFDLVLLDVLMPGMDGWQVLERISADVEIEAPPVYFVSAQDPADTPLASKLLLATVDGGVSINKLLRCSLQLSRLLLTPEGVLGPVPPQTRGA
jgi:signal transduction histidine kinase/CheY-like chemotaxis protein